MSALRGRVVATTRDGSPDDPLVRRLEEDGATVRVWTTLAFAPASDTDALRRAIEGLGPTDWIAFTSARAVDAVTPILSSPPSGVRVAAVGSATAATLTAAGWTVSVTGGEGARGLVQRWAAAYELRDATVLFPAGSLARSTLEDELAMRGARVQRVEAYRTRPTPPERAAVLADLAGGVDAVTLASPSAVGALVDCLGPDWPRALDGCELVAIGPSTRAAVVEAGLPAARVTLAERSSVEGVVQATARALSMRRAPAGGMQR